MTIEFEKMDKDSHKNNFSTKQVIGNCRARLKTMFYKCYKKIDLIIINNELKNLFL